MLLNECEVSNRALISSLRPDANEEALHRIAFDDCAKGRMTKPKRVQCVDTSQVSLFYIVSLCLMCNFMCPAPGLVNAAFRHRPGSKARRDDQSTSGGSLLVVVRQEQSEAKAK